METKIFTANYKNLASIGEFVVSIVEKAGFSEDDIYSIQTAVDEACSNIIDHAYRGENLGDIEISVEVFKNKIEIIITDYGNPFNPDDVPDPDIVSPLEVRKERGLGVFFIRNLMDEVLFDFSKKNKNILILIKNKGR